MIVAVALATLITIPLLALITFVQVLYLESLRLRTRDLPSIKFFKDTLEDKIGFKTEDGAGAFSLIKHTMLVLLGTLYLAGRASSLVHYDRGFLRAAAAPVPPHLGAMAGAAGPAAALLCVDCAAVRGAAHLLSIGGGSDR